MSDKEYYQQLLDKVFGAGFVQIPDDGLSNNIIGAFLEALFHLKYQTSDLSLFNTFKKVKYGSI